MKTNKLIAAGLVAGACGFVQADTFYWKGGKTWKSFGETMSWDQATFVSGSDTGNATRIPGSGDDLEMACDMYMDLDGASYTVGTFKSLKKQDGSGNNYTVYSYFLTNGTLTVNGLSQVRPATVKVFNGAKLRLKQAYMSNAAGSFENLEVCAGGEVEYFDDYVTYSVNHRVLPGGTYVLSPSANKARLTPGGSVILTNEGTFRIPKDISWSAFTFDASKPARTMTLNQQAGTLELGGAFVWYENSATADGSGSVIVSGGTVRATGAVSFTRVACSFADDADVELNVVEGASFDVTPFAFGSNAQVNKTGAGTLKTVYPLPAGLTVSEACSIQPTTPILSSAALASLPAGTQIVLPPTKTFIDSLSDVQNLMFGFDASFFENGDDLVVSDDPEALTFMQNQLKAQIPQGAALSVIGNRLVYLVGDYVQLEVASGVQTIGQALAVYNAAHGTSYSIADDGESLGSVMLVKAGAGELTFDAAIPKFTGRIVVAEGVAHVTTYYGLGIGASGGKTAAEAEASSTRVKDGATLVMDATDAIADADVKAIEYEAIAYEGAGADGLGANKIRSTGAGKSTVPWGMGHYPSLKGDATIRIESAAATGLIWSPQPDPAMQLNGHTLTLVGANDEAAHPAGVFTQNATKIHEGNIVCTNVEYQFQNVPQFTGTAENHLTIGADAMLCYKGGSNTVKAPWTLVFEEGNRGLKIGTQLVTWDENATNDNYWAGPVLLNGDLNLQNGINANNATRGCNLTLKGKVSGKGGIRPTPYNPNLTSKQGINFHLMNPENDFEGGLVASDGQVVLHAATALPENGGRMILTNSTLCLSAPAGADDYRLPDATFVGQSTIKHGHGNFKNVIKEGEDVLEWFSGAGAVSLTVREGSVAFAAPDSDAYADAASVAPTFGKMTFAAGTQLNLNGRDYAVADLGGVPMVLGGNLTVTGTWTLSSDEARAGRMTVEGQLTFGSWSVLDLSADFKRGTNLLVTATDGIVGRPTLSQASVAQGWRLLLSPDEKSLSIVRQGMILIIK